MLSVFLCFGADSSKIPNSDLLFPAARKRAREITQSKNQTFIWTLIASAPAKTLIINPEAIERMSRRTIFLR